MTPHDSWKTHDEQAERAARLEAKVESLAGHFRELYRFDQAKQLEALDDVLCGASPEKTPVLLKAFILRSPDFAERLFAAIDARIAERAHDDAEDAAEDWRDTDAEEAAAEARSDRRAA